MKRWRLQGLLDRLYAGDCVPLVGSRCRAMSKRPFGTFPVQVSRPEAGRLNKPIEIENIELERLERDQPVKAQPSEHPIDVHGS